MSLITKVGGKESDSFVTVVEADATIPQIFTETEADLWADLTDAEKEYRLRLAAQLMSTLSLRGYRVFCGQNLAFPRDHQEVHTKIPAEVKETQCFIALNVVHRGLGGRSSPDESETGARVSSVSLGGLLSVSFAAGPVEAGTNLDKMIRTSNFPAYSRMVRHLTQVRGRSVPSEDDLPTCSTTTTTTTTT